MLNVNASKIILELPIDGMIMATKEQKRLASANRITPHITLGMAILDYSNYDRVRKVVSLIAKQSRRIDVTIKNLTSAKLFDNDREIAYYELELNKKFWELHLLTMKHIQPHIYHGVVSKGMFRGEDEVDEETITMVADYPSKFAFKSRVPMVELGEGHISTLPREGDFVSKRISLWKVGNKGVPTKEMHGLFLGGRK